MDVGAVKAPTIQRSQTCKRSVSGMALALPRCLRGDLSANLFVWGVDSGSSGTP
jgi:hypothetical protein